MLIKSNSEGPLGIPLLPPKKAGEPESTSFLVAKDKILILLFGWNEVTPEQWECIAPHVADRIADGRLEIYAKKVKDAESGLDTYAEQSFEDVRADKAKEIVQGCYNLEQLYRWEENPKLSQEIRYYIAKQIEYCENGEGPKV